MPEVLQSLFKDHDPCHVDDEYPRAALEGVDEENMVDMPGNGDVSFMHVKLNSCMRS